jgi:hydrogenase expression/formation protein HypD
LKHMDLAEKNPDSRCSSSLRLDLKQRCQPMVCFGRSEEKANHDLENILLVTALKTVLPALEYVCSNQPDIDGFIMPGHVSVITGSNAFLRIWQRSITNLLLWPDLKQSIFWLRFTGLSSKPNIGHG